MENTVNGARKPIDVEFLRSVIENDVEFEKELFTIFADNAKRNAEKMEEAIKSSNDNSWYMASHAFKGAAASVGAFDLSKILEYAQKHPEENYEQKTELLKKIKEELNLVTQFISEEIANK